MKLHLPKALLTVIVASAFALPIVQAEGASSATVKASTDLAYNQTVYTLESTPLNNTLASVYQTTLTPAEGETSATWNVDKTASTKSWGELYGDGKDAANTDNYNTLRIVAAKEYGFNFSTMTLAGVIVESSADGASFKGLGNSQRSIKIGNAGEESASYFGGSFTFDSYTTSNNASSITLNGTQTWHVVSGKEVTLKAKAGISNEGTWTVEGGGAIVLGSEFTNNGTWDVSGSSVTIGSTINNTGSKITTSANTMFNITDISALTSRINDNYNIEENGVVQLKKDYIVINGGSVSGNAQVSYTANDTTGTTNLTDGKYFTLNDETAYGIVKNTTLSDIEAGVNDGGTSLIAVKQGITLSKGNGATFNTEQKLIGNGTYALGSVEGGSSPVLGDRLSLDELWFGTVSLFGGIQKNNGGNNNQQVQNINFNDLGIAGSTIEITSEGLYGYLNGGTKTYAPNIKLTGNLYIQDGSSTEVNTFAGDISGNGSIYLRRTGGGGLPYTFSGNLNSWEGSLITVDNNGSSEDLANNVTLTGKATTVNATIERQSGILNLTVNNSEKTTTFNKNVTVNKLVANSAITLGEGVQLTLAGSSENSSITSISAHSAGNTITLEAEATLNRLATVNGTVTLKGAGTYNMAGNYSANVQGLNNGDNWTGKVILSGAKNELNFNDYGNANSTIEIGAAGITNHLNSGDTTYTSDIVMTGNLALSNGWSGNTKTFSGDVSGNGTFSFNYNGTTGDTGTFSQAWKFTGNVSEWRGAVTMDSKSGKAAIEGTVVFSGTSTINLASITKSNSAKLHVTIDDANLTDTTAGVTVNSAITANTLTLGNENDTADNRASVTVNENVTVDTLTNHAATKLANGKSLTTGALSVGSADGANAATLTGGAITKTEIGATISTMTLGNAKLTGANANTSITLQNVAGAATLATGTYTVAAVAGAATAAAEDVALSFTLGGLTGLTLDNADTKLVINTGDVLAAVGDAESFTLSFNFGDGISLYDGEWTAEALSGAITFGGVLGEWLSGSETEYTLASDAVATASLDGLVPTVTYAMTNGVLSSITVSGNIPEPTTATLSLLALSALAARRRRR